MNRLRASLEGLSGGRWIALQSVLALIAVAGAQIILDEVRRSDEWSERLLLAAALLIGAIVYFWIALVAARVREHVFPKHPSTVLAVQRELLQALNAENRRITNPRGETKKERHSDGMAAFMQAMQRAISQQWSEFRFGSSTQTEVVLMTESLRDNRMICASWAVRRPQTLSKRERDPTVYEDTEAARMYRLSGEGRAVTRIIPDTLVPKYDYTFLNTSENERIRSTVLHPVYDPDSELVGVIVAHTNRPKVFRQEDLDFWTEFFRLVEPHVARRIILARTEDWAGDPPW